MTVHTLHSARIEGYLCLAVAVSLTALLFAYRSIARISAKPVAPIEKELPLVAPGIVFGISVYSATGAMNLLVYALTESRLAEIVAGCFIGIAIITIGRRAAAFTAPVNAEFRPSRTMAAGRVLFAFVMGLGLLVLLAQSSSNRPLIIANELMIATILSVLTAGIAIYIWRERYDARTPTV